MTRNVCPKAALPPVWNGGRLLSAICQGAQGITGAPCVFSKIHEGATDLIIQSLDLQGVFNGPQQVRFVIKRRFRERTNFVSQQPGFQARRKVPR